MEKLEEYPLAAYFRPDWLGRYLGVMAGSDGILHHANEAVRRLVGCDQKTATRALKWFAQHNWGEYRPQTDEWYPVIVTQPANVLRTRRRRLTRAPATQVVAPTDASTKEESAPSSVSSESPAGAEDE